jgi:hypothetical protein
MDAVLTLPTPLPRPRRPRRALAEIRAERCRLHTIQIEAQMRVTNEALALARRFSREMNTLRSENTALRQEHTLFGYETDT